MSNVEWVLSAANIGEVISRYRDGITDVGAHLGVQRGVQLLLALKRDAVGAGPYPNVTLFEAANRIMTDLVMLHGVRWLLKHEVFPFRAYTVEYGHGNEGEHNIVAREDGKAKIGEVFNVAPSYVPKPEAGEYLLFVDIQTGACRVVAARS